MKIAVIYLIGINLLTFVLYGIDKWKAQQNYWRVPEKTLILLAVIGGAVGALAGMILFRHKIRKPKFYLGVPFILFAQIAAVCWFVERLL